MGQVGHCNPSKRDNVFLFFLPTLRFSHVAVVPKGLLNHEAAVIRGLSDLGCGCGLPFQRSTSRLLETGAIFQAGAAHHGIKECCLSHSFQG